jgi:hypothetical protein
VNVMKFFLVISVALEESELQVSVPSYLLRGAGAGTHYEYEVRVSVGGTRWTLLRRYKRFRELHLAMRSKYGSQVWTGIHLSTKSFSLTLHSYECGLKISGHMV